MAEKVIMHYGVKGMRWGQTRIVDSKEVGAARKRVRADGKAIKSNVKAARKAMTQEDAERHAETIRSTAKRLKESGDIEVATMTTRGDKIALSLTYGPFGPAIARQMNRQQELVTKALVDEYKDVSVRDLTSRR